MYGIMECNPSIHKKHKEEQYKNKNFKKTPQLSTPQPETY